MIELIQLRQENSKTYDVGSKKRGLLVSMGAIHYKDNYASNEQWKDIDLTWVGNKITKTPYELTLEGKKLTIRDKKTAEVSTIELLEIGGKSIKSPPDIAWEKSKGLAKAPGIINLDNVALDTDLEIVAENGRVKFSRICKSDKAPLEATFEVTGNWISKAQDEDGDLPVESTLKDGILTETLKADRVIKYPVRIDPTWQVAASADDCLVYPQESYFTTGDGSFKTGYYGVNSTLGAAARFLNITIPVGSTITLANFILTCRTAQSATIVNTRLRAEANINPATFSTLANFNARIWTTAYMNWDAIPAWTVDVKYTSPSDDGTRYFKDVIQEVIDLANWASGNPIAVLWDDFEKRSTQSSGRQRTAQSYDGSTTKAPKLYIVYPVPVKSSLVPRLIAMGQI